MKKHGISILLAALALILVLGANLRGAMAYFTTYVVAEGGYPIRLGSSDDFHEEISNWTKRLSVEISEDSEDAVYVRARGFCGSLYTLSYDDVAGNWTDGGDGWYYYNILLHPGEGTTVLDVHIEGVPAEPEEGEGFHVVVVYETTPVQYREDGTPYADWSLATQTSEAAEGGDAP